MDTQHAWQKPRMNLGVGWGVTPCEAAGVHLTGTGHSQTECPTVCPEVTVREVAEAWDYMSNIDGRDYAVSYGCDPSTVRDPAQLVTDAHYTRTIRVRQGKEV